MQAVEDADPAQHASRAQHGLETRTNNTGMPHASPPLSPPSVVLCTLNAKYIHASLGLRYLLANMGDLKPRTALREFTIARKPKELADELVAINPQVIGFGVYIWNVTQTCAVVRLLKAQRPDIKIVLGGPEVSHEVARTGASGG